MWQRSLALEVLHKLVVQPELLNAFCECYDLKTHTTNIFQDIVNSLGAYVQSLFVNPQLIGQSGITGWFKILKFSKISVLPLKDSPFNA